MIRNLTKSLCMVLLLSLALTAGKVFASPEPVARVIVAGGNVTAKSEDSARSLERRSRVYEGESVLTGEASRAQLRFDDGAVLSLDPGTELVIRAYRHQPGEPEESEALLEMVTGGLRTLTGAMADEFPEGYEVETPVAGIGIRGTDFQAVMGEDGLAVGVWEDSIHVTNEAGTVDLGPELAYQFAFVADALTTPRPTLQRPPQLTPSGVLAEASDRGEENAPPSQIREIADSAEQSVEASADEEVADLLVDEESFNDRQTGVVTALPEWYVPDSERPLQAILSFGPQEGSASTLSAQSYGVPWSSTDTFSDQGLVIGGFDELSGSDLGWFIPQESLEPVNEVPDFPVIWGNWDDSEEVVFFNFPEVDDTTTFESGPAEDIFDLSQGGWLVATEPPLSLEDVADIRAETVAFGVETLDGTVLTSTFSDGELDEQGSSINFGINLQDQAVVNFDLELRVNEGDTGQLWSASSATLEEALSEDRLALSLNELSLEQNGEPVDLNLAGDLGGFIVASDEGEGLGAATGVTLRGSNPDDGSIVTEGNVLLFLPEL